MNGFGGSNLFKIWIMEKNNPNKIENKIKLWDYCP